MSNQLYRQQPSSPATGQPHLPVFTTLLLPQTPSSSNTTTTTETSTTPESLMAAALGRAIFNISSTSFQEALTATNTATNNNNNPLLRTISDANSSVNQDLISPTTATPPRVPTNYPICRANSEVIPSDYQQQSMATTRYHKPLRRALSDATEYQQPLQKTRTPPPHVSSSQNATPESSIGKRSPQLEKMKKIEDMVRDIERRCLDIMSEGEQVEDEIPEPVQPESQHQEECVGAERLKNGDLRFDLSCSCGKQFEMLLKKNGYCFYRLT